jgi:hypothetical protein
VYDGRNSLRGVDLPDGVEYVGVGLGATSSRGAATSTAGPAAASAAPAAARR